MKNKIISSAITSFRWGCVETSEGHKFKDAKLFPGGAREWDWNETGTHHKPGIQPADIQELLDNDAQILILSKGINERLQTADETIQLLEQHEIPYHILQTEKAVKKYNELRKEHAVGSLIHSTC